MVCSSPRHRDETFSHHPLMSVRISDDGLLPSPLPLGPMSLHEPSTLEELRMGPQNVPWVSQPMLTSLSPPSSCYGTTWCSRRQAWWMKAGEEVGLSVSLTAMSLSLSLIAMSPSLSPTTMSQFLSIDVMSQPISRISMPPPFLSTLFLVLRHWLILVRKVPHGGDVSFYWSAIYSNSFHSW